MTTSPNLSTTTIAPEIDRAGADTTCAVCNHALADHDSIGLRFCQATHAQALTRNCICAGAAR